MAKTRRSFLLVLVGIALTLLRPTAAAAQPVPQVNGVMPIYLRQSESREITFTGTNLAGATSAAVTDASGLSADVIAAAKPSASEVKIKLTTTADAALGGRELRIVTPSGVSSPVAVTIGQYAAVEEKEPNNTPDVATPVTFPASIIGRVDAGGDLDYYRFEAKKGQHLVFDVSAARIGSALEPVIAILDASGREQSRSVTFHEFDPTLFFEAPADGAYTLLVRDLQYRGGNDYPYRIEAGEIPYVESILPAGGKRGDKVEVHAIGQNLGDGATMTVDLADAAPGVLPLRFKTALGMSNAVPFAVDDVGHVTEKPGNNKPENATPVSLPAEVSGVLAKPAEEDYFRFSVPTKQAVTVEVQGRRIGSPIDALLSLRDAKGNVIEQNNGADGGEARFSRTLEPGDYIVSLRDLSFGGGPEYGYQLRMTTVGGVPPDFAVRFMPDALRLPRGGHAKVWCEIVRRDGYKGNISLTFDGLPPGVSITDGPAMIGESTSGVFTVTASPDAALGSAPIKLRATGSFGAQQTTHMGRPELGGRALAGAYLSVLEKAPFAVDSIARITPEQITAYQPLVQGLFARLNSGGPELDKAQAEWEKKVGIPTEWTTVEVTSSKSVGGAELKKQADGSLLATGTSAERDTYTIVGAVSAKEITAIRLETLPDATLPLSGPGRSASGNFVLNHFIATVGNKSDPAKIETIVFSSAKATFEQGNYGVGGAIDDNPQSGWAIFGGVGKPQTAWFFPSKPISAGEKILTFTLDQQYGEQHTLGRFRIAVTADPTAKDRLAETAPAEVVGILRVEGSKRTPEQKSALAAYYRSIAPELKADRGKLAALQNTVGPLAEVSRLEALLNIDTPAIEAERRDWEQAISAGIGWTALDATETKAANGTNLVKEKDGSITASGLTPATETYTVAATAPLRAITAVRLEVLSDDRLPGGGPGRAADGNFVLTKFEVAVASGKNAGAAGMQKAPGAVPLREGYASFEQQNFGLAGTLDGKADSGWAIAPLTGRPHAATFFPKVPIVSNDGGSTLTFTLEFNAPKLPGFSIGRFRLWVLGAADAATAANIPAEIQDILKAPDGKRSEEQKAELASFYRSIAPALEPTRQRLTELKRRLPTLPISVARNKSVVIPVPVERSGEFTGAVQLTLEGFSAGRDPGTRMPNLIAKNMTIAPLSVDPDAAFGKLNIKVNGNCELGTRMVVIKAEAKVGNDTYVEYSPAFPMTVTEK